MAFHGHVDARLVRALGAMTDLSYAEAWRCLAPIARRLRVRRPSYASVRRALLRIRSLEQRRKARLGRRVDLASDLLAGRVPHRWLNAAILGTTRASDPCVSRPRPP